MEFLTLAGLIKYGTPVLLFALVISNVSLIILVRGLIESVSNLKEGVLWKDTYEKIDDAIEDKFKGHEKRLDRLELKVLK